MSKFFIMPAALNLTDAASYLNVGTLELKTLLDNGEIPFRKIGSRYLIAVKALDKWLEKAETE